MARALGKVLFSRGVPIVAIGGRDTAQATAAADFIGCSRGVKLHNLPSFCSQVLISVSDDAIPAVVDQLVFGGLTCGLALHTCGAHGPEILAPLRPAGNEVGVFHPLVGVPQAERGVIAMPGATFACAGDPAALEWGLELVEILEGQRLTVDPEHWHLYQGKD
jgi:predicted short-subunit dehydrogenase-like oxidoreductase (DUF2520 family)